LLKAKKIAQPGIEAFEAREKHRTGIYAFEQKRPGLSAKYKKLLRVNRRAWEFFAKQAPWYQRTAGYWVSSAKQEETRARRLAKLMQVSAAGRRLDQLTPKAKRGIAD
jgi:phytoene dehydrogenase-like protein